MKTIAALILTVCLAFSSTSFANHPLLETLHNAIKRQDYRSVSCILFGYDISFSIELNSLSAGWFTYRAEEMRTLLSEANEAGENAEALLEKRFDSKVENVIRFAKSVIDFMDS